jgi:hypothetical protein
LARIQGGGGRCDDVVSDIHPPRAVETLHHVCLGASVTPAPGAGRQLEDDVLNAHGVVQSDLSDVVEGTGPRKIAPARDHPE